MVILLGLHVGGGYARCNCINKWIILHQVYQRDSLCQSWLCCSLNYAFVVKRRKMIERLYTKCKSSSSKDISSSLVYPPLGQKLFVLQYAEKSNVVEKDFLFFENVKKLFDPMGA